MFGLAMHSMSKLVIFKFGNDVFSMMVMSVYGMLFFWQVIHPPPTIPVSTIKRVVMSMLCS